MTALSSHEFSRSRLGTSDCLPSNSTRSFRQREPDRSIGSVGVDSTCVDKLKNLQNQQVGWAVQFAGIQSPMRVITSATNSVKAVHRAQQSIGMISCDFVDRFSVRQRRNPRNHAKQKQSTLHVPGNFENTE